VLCYQCVSVSLGYGESHTENYHRTGVDVAQFLGN
jgi:hypothetical protein